LQFAVLQGDENADGTIAAAQPVVWFLANYILLKKTSIMRKE
jgi:hypothetical protein